MEREKPYLRSISKSADRMETTMQWARYLGETFGTSGALNCLRYYERLGWISSEVREEMIRYIRGLSLSEIHNKKYDEPATLEYPLETLSGTPFGTHARSLKYVAKIAGDDLEEHLMLARLAERRVDKQLGDRSARKEVIEAIGDD
ncbi:FlaD/FlaE family flagellar protein [Halorubellus salinus]|uniref:FlaD/FlaE family flagellar protein n=1 Tax=Halorubellus salinus TaxID=755309 RepID=UPI001D066FCA|nr:FlaD/FlaE family flagellar protein [Halorubellus salinus]